MIFRAEKRPQPVLSVGNREQPLLSAREDHQHQATLGDANGKTARRS
jgi:hypothetical protein